MSHPTLRRAFRFTPAAALLILFTAATSARAQVVLTVDISNPAAGFTITDVSGGALGNALGGGHNFTSAIYFQNFFTTPGSGTSSYTGGTLADNLTGHIVGENGLSASSLILIATFNGGADFQIGVQMFAGGPANTFGPGLTGGFPAVNATGNLYVGAGPGQSLGQWQAIAVPEPSSTALACAAAGAILLSQVRRGLRKYNTRPTALCSRGA
ncbi:MAG: hypothetical protein U0835_09885 [Isosphaeraceae bacterium]